MTLVSYTKQNFYSREELLTFLATYKKLDQPKGYTFFLLLAFTELRKGEALTLTWRDVDFSNKTLIIDKTLAAGKNGTRLIQRPKQATVLLALMILLPP